MLKNVKEFIIDLFIITFILFVSAYVVWIRYSLGTGISLSLIDFRHWLTGGALESWRNAFEVWGISFLN